MSHSQFTPLMGARSYPAKDNQLRRKGDPGKGDSLTHNESNEVNLDRTESIGPASIRDVSPNTPKGESV